MRDRIRSDRGSAALELLAMIPLALSFAVLVLQFGGAMWAVGNLNEAVRQGARASSVGQDGCAAARQTLSPTLDPPNRCVSGPPGTVVMEIDVPMISDYLPQLTVERDAVLPDTTP